MTIDFPSSPIINQQYTYNNRTWIWNGYAWVIDVATPAIIASAAFDKANSANVIASSAFDKANSANVIASAAFDKANSANVIASAAFDKANSANVIASAAFDKANSANVIASAAFDKANSANVIASSAFDKANSANVIASAAFDKANSANVIASAAFDKANSANVIASAAFDKANSANVIASAAFDRANNANLIPIQKSGIIIGTRNALNFIEGSNVTLTISDDSINDRINVTISSLGGGGGDSSIAIAAFDKANSQANLSFSTVIANGTSLVADSNADTLTILTSGNVAITADAAGDNMTFDLTTTGVVASTYGSNTIVPVFTVDARGRLTSVTNTTIDTSIASSAFDKANSANVIASAAFDKANSANVIASSAFDKANSANVIASSAFDKANSANVIASAAFDKANSANVIASAAFDKANSANVIASAAFDKANSANVIASAAFDKANSANVIASSAFDKANSANVIASSAFDKANSANVIASAAFDKANSANVIASAAFDKANSANVIASAAFDKANSANVIASVAFDFANTRLSANGGTIFGSLTVSGNLTISGNTVFNNVSTYRIDDPLIYLAANNYVSDLVDIGFVANYVNTTGSNVHTGLMRDSGTKEYYLFQGYDQEPQNNHIDPSGNNFTISFLNANVRSSNIILNNINVDNWIQSSYNKANSANVIASAAFDKANSQANLSFSTVIANGTSLVADSNSDTLTILTSGNVSIIADASGDNMTFDLTTTGVTAATYGSTTIVPVLTVDSRGRITSVTNTIINTFSFGVVAANGTNLVADTSNDTLTIRTTGNVAITADAAGDNMTFDLTTTGVTAATYGSATIVPVLTVDARGRLTSVTNTTMNVFAFGIVAANGTSLVADTSNDTLTIRTTGNVAITADAAGDNMTFDLTTTGVTAATYGSATVVPVLTVDARGRLTSATNTTIDTSIATAAFDKANQQTNLAFSTVVANGISLVADSNADTLTIRTTGNVSITADAAGDNMTFDLTTTGVTAATYGSATVVPVLTVDARGRLTSVTNTTIDTSIATAAFLQANTANTTSIAAFAKANLAAPIASPTFTGTVTVPSSLIVLKSSDPSEGGEINFEKTSGSNISGNLVTDLFNDRFRIFEQAGTNRGFFLDLTKANTGVSGEILHTNNWFNFISTSTGDSTAAFNKANAQANLAFSTVVANGISLAADSNADTLTILTTGNVSITADAAGDNMTFDLTTTGVTAATYGSATIVPVLTVDSRGRLTSVTNTTINVFSFGIVAANGTNLVADTSNDTLTIRTTGNVAITADAAGDNMTFDLTTTGVTAATYGSATVVPVLTVDARGRLTSVTNTSINVFSFGIVAANGTSLVADTSNDTLTILTTGNVSITADAAGDNMTFDLTTTGVTAATYGSATVVPVLTVDARGRLTSVTNTTINTFAFGIVAANGTNLVADTSNDTLTIRTTGNVAITADAAGDNMTFDLTTTGVTAATYGSATIVPVLTVDARGRLTSVTNTTINTFAFGIVSANGTSLVADTSNDTLTIRTTGNVAITADAAGDNMTFDLTTTGVTAATYGSDTIVPVLAVDSRGRITSVSNVTISTTGGSSSNSFVYVSDSPPANVANGFLWWQSNTGSLYIRYGDGDSSQWVATQQQGLGGSATFTQPAANAIAQSPTQLLASANGLTYTSSTFTTSGDATVNKYMLIGTTTNATPLRLLHGGGSGLISVGSNTTMQYTVDISARRTDVTGEGAGWTLKGLLDSFSGTVTDVGNLYEIVIARDDANYVVDALANNTSKSLDIMVTGVNAKTIRWVAFVQTVEVSQ